jgi:hypothetical protein
MKIITLKSSETSSRIAMANRGVRRGRVDRLDNAMSILTFCVSGMPIGINIPNYDKIHLHEGFKNVLLSNWLSSMTITAGKFSFLTENQIRDFIENFASEYTLITAPHELHGHGSGESLFAEDIECGISDLFDPGRKIEIFYRVFQQDVTSQSLMTDAKN